jgi:hypothetical protein
VTGPSEFLAINLPHSSQLPTGSIDGIDQRQKGTGIENVGTEDKARAQSEDNEGHARQ